MKGTLISTTHFRGILHAIPYPPFHEQSFQRRDADILNRCFPYIPFFLRKQDFFRLYDFISWDDYFFFPSFYLYSLFTDLKNTF